MRGITISSLAFILALSSTVAVAAPKAVVNVLEGDLNVRSDSCMKSGPCSVFSPPRTCCGICNLIDAEMVSQDEMICLQQVLTPQHHTD